MRKHVCPYALSACVRSHFVVLGSRLASKGNWIAARGVGANCDEKCKVQNARREARGERVVIRQRQTNIETAGTLWRGYSARETWERQPHCHTYTMNEKPEEGELLEGKAALQRQFTNECGLFHLSQSVA